MHLCYVAEIDCEEEMTMRKLYLLGICVITMLVASCNPQGVPTLEISPTSTSRPPAALPSNVVLTRGNPERTGLYNLPAIRLEPQIKWQSKISTTWLIPPLVTNGILYTGSGDGSLYALNAETGEEIWSEGGFGQLESTGAIAGDVIVTGGYSQLVKALNRKTGADVWSFKTDYLVQGAPLIIAERVYIATDRMVYALDLRSGQLLWKAATGTEEAFMGAPASDGGVIYTTGGKLLLALDAETGKERWRVEKNDIFLSLAVANGLIYVGNWDHHLYAFNQSTGEERWNFEGSAVFWSAPAVDENTVYAGNEDQMYALHAESGELLWSFETAGRSVSEPLLSDGVVYVSDSSHEFPRGARHLYALDATSGEQLWVFETVSTFLPAPALGDGVIYITSTGEVIALQ
jgi:eukaryotic-like serine/threonine-protein kinase